MTDVRIADLPTQTTTPVATDYLVGNFGTSAQTRKIPFSLLSSTNIAGSSIHALSAVGDGIADDTATIQSTFNAYRSIYIPPGTYKCTSTINVPNNTIIWGAGFATSVFQFTNLSDGFANLNTINGNIAANVYLRDIGLVCTNGSNTEAAFNQVGGTYIGVQNVWLKGFKYGVIFDQTEVSYIRNCIIEFNTYCGIWLVNGSAHTPTGLPRFTNCLEINGNQLNANPYQIIDDGGTVHTIEENNINGGTIGVRVAGASLVSISKNELEHCSTACIALETTVLSTGSAVGGCIVLKSELNNISVDSPSPAVTINGGSAISFNNNYLQTNGVTGSAFTGVSTCQNFTSINNDFAGFTSLLDTYSTNFQEWGSSNRTESYKTFYSPSRLTSSLAVYCPSNFGGGSSVGGIDLQAYTSSNTKATYARIAPALWDNTVGAEIGGINFSIKNAGTETVFYNFQATNFSPTTDITLNLGGSAKRWTNTYSKNFYPGDGTVTWTSGTGTPEGVTTAVIGSMFTRTDGGANTTLYIKESGVGNTGWIAK